MSRQAFDWAGLLRAGIGPAQQGGLALTPDLFWSLTPIELSLMLGIEAAGAAMTRDRLAELAARYPDRARVRDLAQESQEMSGATG